MALSTPFPRSRNNFFFSDPKTHSPPLPPRQLKGRNLGRPGCLTTSRRSQSRTMRANAARDAPDDVAELSQFPLFQPPPVEESPSELEPADPDFYKIGYARNMTAYGIELNSKKPCSGMILPELGQAQCLKDSLCSKCDNIFSGMLNHSFEPNCFLHWCFKDRMLEVMINAGQRVSQGDEMTINYLSRQNNNMLMQRYDFSSPVNPWELIVFSSNSRIHLDFFLSVFNIAGLQEEYYHNYIDQTSRTGDTFVDGEVLAAARALPTWSDGDVPMIPSLEKKAARDLQEECRTMLAKFSTTIDQDEKILDSMPPSRLTL